MTIDLLQHFVKTIQFSSNTDLLRQKLKLFELHLKNVQLKLITDSIESFLQDTDTEMFTISAFSTFLIVIHDDTQTRTEEAVMTEYY